MRKLEKYIYGLALFVYSLYMMYKPVSGMIRMAFTIFSNELLDVWEVQHHWYTYVGSYASLILITFSALRGLIASVKNKPPKYIIRTGRICLFALFIPVIPFTIRRGSLYIPFPICLVPICIILIGVRGSFIWENEMAYIPFFEIVKICTLKVIDLGKRAFIYLRDNRL